jgi:hypothetical protein
MRREAPNKRPLANVLINRGATDPQHRGDFREPNQSLRIQRRIEMLCVARLSSNLFLESRRRVLPRQPMFFVGRPVHTSMCSAGTGELEA